MAKKKTDQTTLPIHPTGEWTNWDYNAKYEYSTGNCYTVNGIIELYHQQDAAQAHIIHNSRRYSLYIHDPVTRLGVVRIAKKWARSIRKVK